MQWNYTSSNKQNQVVTLTYWINTLQNLKTKDYFVSLNETQNIDNVIEKYLMTILNLIQKL